MARSAKIVRETEETSLSVEVNIDGSGKHEIETGLVMFDHMLSQLSRHGVFDLAISSKAKMDPDGHHSLW